MAVFAGLLAVIVSSTIHITWGGYVLSILWGWFVVPLGMAQITLLHAAGLQVVLNTFMGARGMPSRADSEHEDAIFRSLAIPIVLPTLGLLFGWLIHTWM